MLSYGYYNRTWTSKALNVVFECCFPVIEAKDKSAGSLLLTKASKEKPSIGTAIADGPGSLDEEDNRKPVSLAPGKRVLYSKYAGNDLKGSDVVRLYGGNTAADYQVLQRRKKRIKYYEVSLNLTVTRREQLIHHTPAHTLSSLFQEDTSSTENGAPWIRVSNSALRFQRYKMGSTGDEVVEIESLKRSLLPESLSGEEETEADGEPVLYTASFAETEDDFVKYQTARWVLYSLVLILAWGIGLFMLLYIPVRRYILRKDIRSRKLYLTPNSIVYKVIRPVPIPCFGVLKKEKLVLLPSVADVVIEQGYLQSLFGVYSLRIENVGVRRPPSDDVQIQGIANPSAFRKAVLTRLSNMRTEVFSRQVSAIEDSPNLRIHSPASLLSPQRYGKHDAIPHSGDLALLQKLEEVGSSVKRVQTLIEGQHGLTSETAD